MSIDFKRIKKYSKTSNNFDEKLEYLNKELKKTGLCEIANTTGGLYVGSKENPNEEYAKITGKNFNGKGFAMSGDSNLGQGTFGGASIRADGAALSPPHPVSGERRTTQTKGGLASGGFKLAIPGERPSPSHRMTGPIMWYWDPTGGGGSGSWQSLEFNSPEVHGNSPYPTYQAGWGYWGSNFLGFPMLRNDGLPFASLFTTIDNFDPKDSTPSTTVITRDDLGDPSFLPINIDGMSPQGFDYLKNKAYADKIARTGKYPNASDQKFLQDYLNNISDPARQQSERMRIFKLNGVWFPLASAGSAGEPVSDTKMPGLGAKPGDKLAGFFGDSPEKKAAKELKKVVDKGRSGMLYNKTLQFAHQAASGQNYGTASNPRDEAAFIKKFKITPQQFLKYAASGDVKHLKDIQVNKILNQSYQPEGDLLSEDVKLGHFEPEVLNVNIDDLRKGIAPEFPKDPPPEMIDGYAANSRLAPKKIESSPFIKITKKDIAKNHLLTDKQISDFMNDIKMINDYIKKNPADLIYAQQRYPKHDPRLAQLNWQMDQMLDAGKEYVDKQFPENQKLFNQIKKKIKNTIDQTDPKNFKGTKLPKFDKTSLEDFKRKKDVYSRFMKKPVKTKNRFHLDMKDVKKRHLKKINTIKIKEEENKKEKKVIQEIAKKHKSDWRKDLREDFTVVSSGPTNSVTQTFQHASGQNFSFSGLGGQEVHPSTVTVFGDGVPAPNYNQLALAGYAKPLGNVLKRNELEDTNSKLDASQEFAKKVGADVMMNARVDSKKTDEYYKNRQKSGYYTEKLGPIHGAMTDLDELKMNEKLVQENERQHEIYKKNEATRAKHQKVIDEKIKPHLDQINSGLDKKIDLRTLYQRGAVVNDDGTRGLMIRRETTSAMGLSLTKTVITSYRGKNISTVGSVANREKLGITGQGKMTKVAEIKDPRLIEYKMPEELEMWQSQSVDPKGALTRSAGAQLAKGGVKSAFDVLNYYIDNHVMSMYDPNFDSNKQHNLTHLITDRTKEVLQKGMNELKEKGLLDQKNSKGQLDKTSIILTVNQYFKQHGGLGDNSLLGQIQKVDIFNSLGNSLGFNVDHYAETGNYQFDSTYKFTSTLDMGVRLPIAGAIISALSRKYVSGQLHGETMMAVQNPMQFQVDIESGKQYSSEPSKTEPVSKQPTTKEPSKAVKKIKSMTKTRGQSLSLDEPIVRRKKKRG